MRWLHELLDDHSPGNYSSWGLRLCPIVLQTSPRVSCTISFLNQVQGMTSDPKRTFFCVHTHNEWIWRTYLFCWPHFTMSMSLNIDMKMIRPRNRSGSHAKVPIFFRISFFLNAMTWCSWGCCAKWMFKADKNEARKEGTKRKTCLSWGMSVTECETSSNQVVRGVQVFA